MDRGFRIKFYNWPPYWKMAGGIYKSNFIFLSLVKNKVKSPFFNFSVKRIVSYCGPFKIFGCK